MAQRVIRDARFVFVVMGDRMRTRSDERHLATQHIEKLRQFVDTGTAQQSTEPSHAPVVRRGLDDPSAIFGHPHRAKLEHDKFAVVETAAALAEDRWSRAFEANQGCDRQQRWRQRDQRRRCDHDV